MCRTVVILAILIGHSAVAADNEYVYAFKGEQYPEAPFVLTVALDRDAARLGDTVTVTYRLANTSDVAVSTCATGWSEYTLTGADGEATGLVIVHKDGISSFNFLRLPPQTTLSWESSCKVLDVAPGKGSFVGRFQASPMCSYLWQGKVESDPIPIAILPAGE